MRVLGWSYVGRSVVRLVLDDGGETAVAFHSCHLVYESYRLFALVLLLSPYHVVERGL